MAVRGGHIDPVEINDGGPISDGDGTERKIWVIEDGDSDPPEANPQDIIFVKES